MNNRANGGRIGGRVRALRLTPEERTRIARQGAAARWGYKATHKGNFKKDFGIDVDCYILNDERKTAVISQTDMGVAIGLGRSGGSLPRFLYGERISKYLSTGLLEKLNKPLCFQWRGRVQVYGFNIELLIDICDTIINANAAGVFTQQSAHIVRQAGIIRTASAKQGIKTLAWAVAGYDPTKEEIINEFKCFIADEASEYSREFPDELYEGWSKLYDLPMGHKCGNGFYLRSPKYMHLTRRQVYWTLAKSEGRIHKLLLDQRDSTEEWKKRLHQFLSEIGKKALRRHLGRILGIMDLSNSKDEFESNLEKVFGKPPT